MEITALFLSCPHCSWHSNGVDCIAVLWCGTADRVPAKTWASKRRRREYIATPCADPFPLDPPWKEAWQSFSISTGIGAFPLHKNNKPSPWLSLVTVLKSEVFSNSPQHWKTCAGVMSSDIFPCAALVRPWTCKVGLCHTRSFKEDVCPSNKFYLGFAVRKPLKEQEAGSDCADVSLDLAVLKGMRLV